MYASPVISMRISIFQILFIIYLVDVTVWFKTHLCCCITNAKKCVLIAWAVSIIFVLCAVIAAFVLTNEYTKASETERNSAGDDDDDDDDSIQEGHGKAAVFMVAWTAIVLLIVSVGGSLVLKQYRSSMSIGAFLGVIFVLFNQMLILFIVFAERSSMADQSEVAVQAQKALAAFSFILCAVYGSFGSCLGVFRREVAKQEVATHDDDDVIEFPDAADGSHHH